MKQLAERHRAKFVLVAWPQHTRNTSFFLTEIANWAEAEGVVVIDLSEVLDRYDRAELKIPGDGHPTPLAHQIAGAEIFRVVFPDKALPLPR